MSQFSHVRLGYGAGSVDFAYDPARFDVLDTGITDERELSDIDIARAIESPIDSQPLSSILRPHDRVCVVVPDATRASGSARVAAVLVDLLATAGLSESSVSFLIGGGTHRAPTPEETQRIVGPEIARRFRIESHDAFDDATHISVGSTPRGTPVELNVRLKEADHVILIGAIGFHYFAGFSGGRKGLLPACASDRAIQRNHLLGFDVDALTKAAGVETARLDGNPVSEDMEDAARLLPPSYLVNTVLGADNRIVSVFAGDWFHAHRRGASAYLASHSVSAGERRSVVIASVGGAPRDLNMIQSHKALEHARVVLEDGGDLILLAACTDGLGRADFLDWFVPGGSSATARRLVQDYRINGQTAWGIRWKSERYRVRLVSQLDPGVVRHMGMIPHSSLDAALGASHSGTGYILPRGVATLPVLRERTDLTAEGPDR